MITRRAKAYSSSGSVGILVENWGVQAKLIYKYQILYLSRITIGPCSRRWKFGNPSLHGFWLIHPCDRRTDGQNCDG